MFASELFGNHIVGFPTRRLIYCTGKGKGTPALRNGIHCNQVDTEDDSDAMTDWQGFD